MLLPGRFIISHSFLSFPFFSFLFFPFPFFTYLDLNTYFLPYCTVRLISYSARCRCPARHSETCRSSVAEVRQVAGAAIAFHAVYVQFVNEDFKQHWRRQAEERAEAATSGWRSCVRPGPGPWPGGRRALAGAGRGPPGHDGAQDGHSPLVRSRAPRCAHWRWGAAVIRRQYEFRCKYCDRRKRDSEFAPCRWRVRDWIARRGPGTSSRAVAPT